MKLISMVKPQIVSLDVGENNKDLKKTTSRLLKGASWKKQRVIMLIPAGDTIPAKVYLSHCSLVFPPNQSAHRMLAIGMEVGDAFSSSIEQILMHPDLSQWEYILTIEHDNIPQPDGLVRLIERMEEYPGASVISGLYFTKGYGGVAQCWGDPNDPVPNYRPQVPRADGGMMEVCGTGMGFALWRLSMFKDERLRRPWFKTSNGMNGEGVGTQDLYFASDARKYGYKFYVDCGCKVGHYDLEGKYGQPDMTW